MEALEGHGMSHQYTVMGIDQRMDDEPLWLDQAMVQHDPRGVQRFGLDTTRVH